MSNARAHFRFLKLSLFGALALQSSAFAAPYCMQQPAGQVCVSTGSNVTVRLAADKYATCYVRAIDDAGQMTAACENGQVLTGAAESIGVVGSLSSLEGVSVNSDIVVREADKAYVDYFVSGIYTDGVFKLYQRDKRTNRFIERSELSRKRVANQSSRTVEIQTFQGPKAVEVRANGDVVLKLASDRFETYFVSRIYGDGAFALYNRDSRKTTILSPAEMSAQLVESLRSLGPIQIEVDAVQRDADKTYKTYYVSAIYSDGTVAFYDRDSRRTTYRERASALEKFVSAMTSLDVPIPTYLGEKTSKVVSESDVVIRHDPSNYRSYYVSTIYSDGVVALYDRDARKKIHMSRSELSNMLVEKVAQIDDVRPESDIVERDADRLYKTYYVSALYSDGTFALYDRDSRKTEYRPLALARERHVTNLRELTFPIAAYDGQRDSTIRPESDAILRLSPGKYQYYYVSAIYSDQVVGLYDRDSRKMTYHRKNELEKLVVENVRSIGRANAEAEIAIPQVGQVDPLARDDLYVSALYTDGVAALYDRDTRAVTYRPAAEISETLIRTVEKIDPFKLGSIYLIEDASSKQEFVQVHHLYEDQVVRYAVLKDPTDKDSKEESEATVLAKAADLKQLKTACDGDSWKCGEWWQKNGHKEMKSLEGGSDDEGQDGGQPQAPAPDTTDLRDPQNILPQLDEYLGGVDFESAYRCGDNVTTITLKNGTKSGFKSKSSVVDCKANSVTIRGKSGFLGFKRSKTVLTRAAYEADRGNLVRTLIRSMNATAHVNGVEVKPYFELYGFTAVQYRVDKKLIDARALDLVMLTPLTPTIPGSQLMLSFHLVVTKDAPAIGQILEALPSRGKGQGTVVEKFSRK